MLVELNRYCDPDVEDVLPSVFLKRVMNDKMAPLPARIMCAAKVIPFIERKPAPALPDEIPLVVNAGEKMHRRTGVKMHHGRAASWSAAFQFD
jgi:hypothetical protein